MVDLVSTSICWHLLILLLQLLLELVRPSLILEDSLIQISSAVCIVGHILVVYNIVILIGSNHLHVVVSLVLHYHAGWVVLLTTSVILLPYYELLIVQV